MNNINIYASLYTNGGNNSGISLLSDPIMWTQEDLSFKELINKRVTTSSKMFYEEFGDFTINTTLDEVWVDSINSNSNIAVSAGKASQRVLFALTEDTSVANQQCYFAFEGGTRIKNWISDKYGLDYTIHLYDADNNEIFPTDPCNWLFNYQTGILIFGGSTAFFSKPFKITGYTYNGDIGQKSTIPQELIPFGKPVELNLSAILPTFFASIAMASDGRYIYYDAFLNTGEQNSIVRIDPNNFTISGCTIMSLTDIDPTLTYVIDMLSDGKYLYVLIQFDNINPLVYGKVARIDLTMFGNSASMVVKDLQSDNISAVGYNSMTQDNRYIYLAPNYNSLFEMDNGLVARIDKNNFTGSATFLDLKSINPDMKSFGNVITDGKYVYMIPLADNIFFPQPESLSAIYIPRIRCSDFSYIDAIKCPSVSSFSPCYGATFDGRYIYMSPSDHKIFDSFTKVYNGIINRIDTKNFNVESIRSVDVLKFNSNFYSCYSMTHYKNLLLLYPINTYYSNGTYISVLNINTFDPFDGYSILLERNSDIIGFGIFGDCFYFATTLNPIIERMKGVSYK